MSERFTKDDPRFDAVLDITDPDFGDKLIEALGVKPGEKLEIVTPQFERTDGRHISYIPKTMAEYEALKQLDKQGCKAVGMSCWGEVPEGSPDAKELWLFPSEWYTSIPEGLRVVTICMREESFIPGETDDDTRFGCLAYGFLYEPTGPDSHHR